MKQSETIRSRIFAYTTMCIMAIIIVIPMLWAFSLAFRSNYEIARMEGLSIHSFIPKDFTVSSFARMFNRLNFVRIYGNTLLVAVTVTAVSLILNSMAGYAFARLNFFGKKVLLLVVIATLIMPIEVLIIPLYMIISKIGLMNSYISLILPFLATGFGIFFMRQFYGTIPVEIEESAFIDGCSRLRIFYSILFPLSSTPLITLGLTTFLAQWDSFIIPVTFISSRSKMMLQVALSYLSFEEIMNDIAVIFAGLVIASVPIVIIFVCLQKYYVAGIATTGLKG